MSNEYRFISLKVIIDRIMRDVVMLDLDLDSAILDAIDCIKLIANPSFFDRQDVYLNIKDSRTELPVNIVNITQAVKIESNNRVSMHSISDPYYKNSTNESDIGNQYKIQGDYIYTNFKEGKIHLVYDALPLDTEGFIMIPDNVTVVKAVEYSIKEPHYNAKWMMGKLTADKYQSVKREKDWYVGKSQSSVLMEGLDSARELSNILGKFISNENGHLDNYSNIGNKEYLRTHR